MVASFVGEPQFGGCKGKPKELPPVLGGLSDLETNLHVPFLSISLRPTFSHFGKQTTPSECGTPIACSPSGRPPPQLAVGLSAF